MLCGLQNSFVVVMSVKSAENEVEHLIKSYSEFFYLISNVLCKLCADYSHYNWIW